MSLAHSHPPHLLCLLQITWPNGKYGLFRGFFFSCPYIDAGMNRQNVSFRFVDVIELENL